MLCFLQLRCNLVYVCLSSISLLLKSCCMLILLSNILPEIMEHAFSAAIVLHNPCFQCCNCIAQSLPDQSPLLYQGSIDAASTYIAMWQMQCLNFGALHDIMHLTLKAHLTSHSQQGQQCLMFMHKTCSYVMKPCTYCAASTSVWRSATLCCRASSELLAVCISDSAFCSCAPWLLTCFCSSSSFSSAANGSDGNAFIHSCKHLVAYNRAELHESELYDKQSLTMLD